MKDLLRWEIKQTLRSKAFIGMGIAFFVCMLLLIFLSVGEGDTGYDLYLKNLSNFTTLVMFLAGVYAGIHFTGAFEDRRIQSAVMAGKNRFGILMAKMISYLGSLAVYYITSVTASSIVTYALYGAGEPEGGFLRAVIARGLVYLLVELSFASICMITSLLIKHTGASITVNLLMLIILYSVGEILIMKEETIRFMQFLPIGQIFITFFDAGTGNLITASFVSVFWIMAVLAVSYLKFRKEELK